MKTKKKSKKPKNPLGWVLKTNRVFSNPALRREVDLLTQDNTTLEEQLDALRQGRSKVGKEWV
jgi:hypothetical protein